MTAAHPAPATTPVDAPAVVPAPAVVATATATGVTLTPSRPVVKLENRWWTRTVVWWHVVFVGVVAVVGVIFALNRHSPVGFVLLAVLFGWYALTGARALHTDEEWLGVAYLGLSLPLLGDPGHPRPRPARPRGARRARAALP